MRTNDFLKSFPPAAHSWDGKVTISFGHPHHGWIQMAVTCTAYVQAVFIDISVVFDPFPEMLRWVGDIIDGKLPTQFIIDEEGYGKVFRASPINEDKFLLEIASWLWDEEKLEEEPLFLYVQVARRQFLSEFLRRWDELVNEKLDAEHWKGSQVDLRTLDVSKIRMAVKE